MARVSITETVHQHLKPLISPGDVVIDATVGNGHDSLFLAHLIGETGRVYGFDVQSDAIAATQQRLDSEKLSQHAILMQRGHEEMLRSIPAELHGKVSVILYNLGYLPGGDKSLTTQIATTINALEQSALILTSGGIISILAYTGHPGGMEECQAVKSWANDLNPDHFEVTITNLLPDHRHPPEWIIVEKRTS